MYTVPPRKNLWRILGPMGCFSSKHESSAPPPAAWSPESTGQHADITEPIVPTTKGGKQEETGTAPLESVGTVVGDVSTTVGGEETEKDELASEAAKMAAASDVVKQEDVSLLVELEEPKAGTFKNVHTRRAPRKHKTGTVRELRSQAGVTLGSALTLEAVVCPAGEQTETWVALHLFDFYNDAMLLFSVVQEYCAGPAQTPCSKMSAGRRVEYLWAEKGGTPQRVPAATYIDRSLDWIDLQLGDQALFPQGTGGLVYPPTFMKQAKVICKRVFRIFAHLFHNHFTQFLALEAAPHLNTAFKYFAMFVLHHKLVEPRELQPLKDLMERLLVDTGVDLSALGGSGGGAESVAPVTEEQTVES